MRYALVLALLACAAPTAPKPATGCWLEQRIAVAGTADTLRVRAHYAVCPDTTNWRNP